MNELLFFIDDFYQNRKGWTACVLFYTKEELENETFQEAEITFTEETLSLLFAKHGFDVAVVNGCDHEREHVQKEYTMYYDPHDFLLNREIISREIAESIDKYYREYIAKAS